MVRHISPRIHLQDWLQGYTLYVRNLTDPSCVTISGSTTSINSIPPPPVVPTTASVTQPHVLCNLEVLVLHAIRS
jgi:hypothetical protein